MKAFFQLCLLLSLTLAAGGAWAGAETSGGSATKAPPKAIELSGKVLETMDGGGYTYLRLKSGGEKVWVAIPQGKVSVGQEVKLKPGYEFRNFNSKALNRSFERLVFSAGLMNQDTKLSPAALKMAHQGASAAPQAAASVPASVTPPPIKSSPMPAPKEKVAKAKGRNAYSIAELYAKRNQLEKKPVVIRARAVRVTQRIMKRNWVHLKDGSGSEAKKNNDIVVTTKDLPKEGDIVTVKGTLYNRIDFGSGYRYELIVQDAKFTK